MPETPVSGGSLTAVQGGGSSSAAAPAGAAKIDVQLLAEKVYKLLLAEARLSRARGTWPAPPRRHGEG